jgi:CRP/FNR family cyclic AMP-dependent transcriptional regulator
MGQLQVNLPSSSLGMVSGSELDRQDRAGLCRLPHRPLQLLERVGHTTSYPKGATLFLEGQAGTGLFLVCQGQVKLYVSENEGKTITLQVAGVGEVLGVSAAISGQPYALGAEALRPTEARFVRREDLLCLMREHPEVALHFAQHLSERYHSACHEMRCVLMVPSVHQKLAKLLLQWLDGDAKVRGLARFSLTHEEIASLIGTSRESVTRSLSHFRKQGIASLSSGTLHVLNHRALVHIAEPGGRHSGQLKRAA